MLTVGQLKVLLTDLPDDMPIVMVTDNWESFDHVDRTYTTLCDVQVETGVGWGMTWTNGEWEAENPDTIKNEGYAPVLSLLLLAD